MNKYITLFGCSVVLLFSTVFTSLQAADNANDGNTHDTRDGPLSEDDGGTGGGDCDEQHSGSPVILKSGEFIWNEVDVVLRGRPSIFLSRYYRSLDARDGYFGKGWSTHCERALIRVITYEEKSETDASLVARVGYVYRLANGRRYTFVESDDGVFRTKTGLAQAHLAVADNGSVSLESGGGEVETYNQRGQLISETDVSGNTINYERNANGELVRISDGAGRFLALQFDSTGHVSTVSDHANRTWQYIYNVDGTLASVTNPAGGVRSYQYTPITRVASSHEYLALSEIVDETGRVVTSVVYDEAGKVASYSQGENVFTYSLQRQFIVKEDSARSEWSYLLDEAGHKIEIWPPVNRGTPQKFAYDESGEVFQYTDMLGSVFKYEKDALGRTVSVETPDGLATFEYEGNAYMPSAEISPLLRKTEYQRDIIGRPLRVISPNGSTTSFTWSNKGDMLSTTDALGGVTTRSYDVHGLLKKQSDPLNRETNYLRDNRGNVTSITNALGNTITLEYDLLDRIVRHTDSSGAQTSYVYDAAGRTTSVVDALGAQTSYDYDEYGRLITETQDNGSTYVYTWTVDNLLSTVTDGLGNTTTYSYDLGKHLTRRVASGVSDSYSYDVLDRLLTATSRTGRVSYTYDALGRVLQETQTGGEINFVYNKEGEPVSIDLFGDEMEYAYDDIGQVTNITTPVGQYDLQRDALGRIVQRTFPSGSRQQYRYDLAGQLVLLDYSQTSQNSFSYDYDTLGQVTGIQDMLNNDALSLSYDSNSRLISRIGSSIYAFQYDAVGNRIENGKAYNTVQQLLEDSQYSYQYDAEGNLIMRLDKVTGFARQFTYDALNRLSTVEESETGLAPFTTIATYQYDPLSRRVSRQSDRETTRYLWQGDRLAVEQVGATINRRFRYAGSMAALEYADEYGTYHVHVNRSGQAIALTTPTGEVVWRRTLSPYSGISDSIDQDVDGDGVAVNFNQTFIGQYRDDVTGLDYNYFRDYDATTGRYITPDPIGIAGGINRYAYTGGNPMMLHDAHGGAICGGICVGVVVVGGVTIHYIRNVFNETTTFSNAVSTWQRLEAEQSIFHTMGAGNEGNIKFISPDGHSEAVFYGDGSLVTNPAVYGTFKFVGPGNLLENTLHGIFDVAPYFLLGNTPSDIFNPDRICVAAPAVCSFVNDIFSPNNDESNDQAGGPIDPDNLTGGGSLDVYDEFGGIGPTFCY